MLDRIRRAWRALLLYPLKQDDMQYPAIVFAYDTCLGHYGIRILKPGHNMIIWCSKPTLDYHPDVRYKKPLETF